MFIFVNKPISAVFYFLGLFFILFSIVFYEYVLSLYVYKSSFYELNVFAFAFISAAFTIHYITFIYLYYLLRGDEKYEIRGVDIRKFKGLLNVYSYFILLGYILAIVITSVFQDPIAGAFLLHVYTVIFMLSFLSYVRAKLISLFFKKNKKIDDFNMDELYQEIRKILLEKVID